MALRYLFIDFDSFFASVEQQLQPCLRNRPVGVVPMAGVETTSCIATSYEAKAYGVKTGTLVREARYLCPGIRFVQADHSRYVRFHERIKDLIHQHIYVEAVLSIDEMYGKLPPHWQTPEIAKAKALAIKKALAKEIGPYVCASIGLAPNRFIAKLASKRDKPNGLVAMDHDQLPDQLHVFDLDDITGIGSGMRRRLRNARINTVEALCAASRRKLHRIWGSVEGDRMWHALRGIDLPLPETRTRTVGHSHVLPPALRSFSGAHATLHRMLQKACRRLRAMDYFTGHLLVQVKFGFELRWQSESTCFPTQDNVTLGKLLNGLWEARPRDVPDPTKVGILCSRLEHSQSHTPSLFIQPAQVRRDQLQRAMDRVNRRHGGRTLYYADAMEAQKTKDAAPMRIAFNHIPDLALEGDAPFIEP
ncbi:MAG: DNA polymerase Y family protein [Coraliomargaritaceae bacterium]